MMNLRGEIECIHARPDLDVRDRTELAENGINAIARGLQHDLLKQ